MPSSVKNYRVGLLLSTNMTLSDYELSIGKQICKIWFYNNAPHSEKYCDLIITDKEPPELNSLPVQQKDCHGTTLIINKISNPNVEQQYERIFVEASSLKYKSLKEITLGSITKTINSELIKHQAKDGKFDSFLLLFNKYTRADLLNRILDLSWLLIPFIFIIGYLLVKVIGNQFGYSISFLCWFVEYEPDCKNNILRELKLLALIYSVFNFKFYYDYILSIFDNINNDLFQFNNRRKYTHKALQLFTPLMLFASALIIFKAIFIFKYSFRIAAENSFINIGSILNRRLPYLQDDYLIYYFLLLDLCLWSMTKNFFMAIENAPGLFSSNRQKNLIKEAQKSFRISIVWDIVILILTAAIFSYFIPDPQSKLAVQLILLQTVYLYINITTIFYDFKYK